MTVKSFDSKKMYHTEHNLNMAVINWIPILIFGPGHAKMCPMTYANNKGADQPAHPHSLFSTIVVRYLDSMICIQGSLFITLCSGSIELDPVISEPCYKGIILYRNYRKMTIWEPRPGRVIIKTVF